MPNWCQNSLQLTAPTVLAWDNFVEHMERHWAWNPEKSDEYRASEEPAGLCGYFVPEPVYAEDSEKSTMPGWWDFRVNNWGTKWEIGLGKDQVVFDPDTLTISMWFDSAWSPPIGVYDAAVEQEWDVRADYFESGMGFIGYYDSDDGENTFEVGTSKSTDAPDWLVERYESEYEWIDEWSRENDRDELTREEYLEKHGEEYIHEWDTFHEQENSN